MGTDISGIAKNILSASAELKASLSGKEKDKGVSASFMQMMSQNQLSSGYSSNVGASSEIGTFAAPEKANGWDKEAYGGYSSMKRPIAVKEATAPEEALQEASGTLEAFEEEVSQVLKEELGVTEEEIADAMEALGISFLDLKNPQDLAALVQELTGGEIGTLFASEAFSNVMEQVTGILEELQTELGIMPEEWDQFCEAFQEMRQDGVSAEDLAAGAQAGGEMPEGSLAEEAGALTQEGPKENAAGMSGGDVRTAGTDAAGQEASAILQTEDRSQEDGAAAETDLEEADVAEQLPAKTEADEASGAGSDSNSGKQPSFLGHSKEPQDAGQGGVLAGQQPVLQEEFAIPAQTGPSYSSQIDAYKLIEQIARNVRVTISQTSSSMEMQLNPEHLGKIYLNISEREGAVRAQIAAQNTAVKEALEMQVAELRQTLSQQGVKVDAIEVTVATHEFEQNLEQNARQEEQTGQRREEAREQGRRNLNRNDLDGLSGLMSEEEELAARIMRDNGNQVDFIA